MVEYSKVNVRLRETQLKKLKTAANNKIGKTLRMDLKIFDGNDPPHELLMTIRQKTKLRNAFRNNMQTNLKLSKAQISKMIQFAGFLGSLFTKLAGPLMKVVLLLAKDVLAPLGITAATSAIDARIQKKIHGSGTTTLIISNKEMNDIMTFVHALEDSNILLKGVTKIIKNDTKEQTRGFLGTLVGTLGSILLGNLLSGKRTIRAGSGNKNGKGILRAS